MEILQSLAYGFSVALTPHNLFYCFLGTVLGTAVGVLRDSAPSPASPF